MCDPLGECIADLTPSECNTVAGAWKLSECVPGACPQVRPDNDECDTGITILPSVDPQVVPFTNVCATYEETYGEITGDECDHTDIGADIWYAYTSSCSGKLTISMCDGADYDSVLAVYSDGTETCVCPTDDTHLIACGDDTCGIFGDRARVELLPEEGVCYTIRVAGWRSQPEDNRPECIDGCRGTGSFTITCEAPVCGDPLAGSCCSANGTPGCDDGPCCEAVCATPGYEYCCTSDWDELCVYGAKGEAACNYCADDCDCLTDITGMVFCTPPDGMTGFGDIVYIGDCLHFQEDPCGHDLLAYCDVNCDGSVNICDLDAVAAGFHYLPDPCGGCGACCNNAPDYRPCTFAGASSCSYLGGIHQGEGSMCSPSPCDCQPPGEPGCGTPDFEDIANGTSKDCNYNNQADECEEGMCCLVAEGQIVCTYATKFVCQGPPGIGIYLGPCLDCPEQSAAVIDEGSGDVFVHVVGPPVGCRSGGEKRKRIDKSSCQPPYYDAWVSGGGGEGTMCHNFGSAATEPIPADFFGVGSDVYDGLVCLEGDPLGVTEYGEFGDADTLISRMEDPFDRCAYPSTTEESTIEIEIVALSLIGVEPITVTYGGGRSSEQWYVAVDLSPNGVLPGTPPSTLTAIKDYCNGGTFTSLLHVQPRFTFTKVGDPGEVRVLDTYDAGILPIPLEQTVGQPWLSHLDEDLGAEVDYCTYFHPAIEDAVFHMDCDCDSNGAYDLCDIEEGLVADCNGNFVPDECDIETQESPDCNANGVPDECETDCNSTMLPDDCDIANGTSQDLNENGIPDECDCLIRSAPVLESTVSDVGHGTRNRYLSFAGGGAGFTEAVRVTIVDMPAEFSYAIGQQMWVGEPRRVTEASGSSDPVPEPTFWVASLQCDPFFTDWIVYESIHVYHSSIVPDGTFDVQLVEQGCEMSEEYFSVPLSVRTSKSGDLVGDCGVTPCTAPQGIIDFVDIAADVDKFKNIPSAAKKSRADIVNSDTGRPEPDLKVDFVDISCVVDAFRSSPCVLPGPPVDPCGR